MLLLKSEWLKGNIKQKIEEFFFPVFVPSS